jgi:fermentation-respiration switch protein FrsA (DUF1100 family)
MMGVVSYIFFLLLLLLAVGLVLSHYMTRRSPLGAARSPAEFGLDFEEVAFKAVDGLTLRGWWIPAATSPGSTRAVIILHGHAGSMDPDLPNVPPLHAAGFNVLMFDFRAHGRSEGKVSTIGYLERMDLLGAVDFLRQKGMHRIGVLGSSMGGIVAMLTAPLCEGIDAVVTDSAPAWLRHAIAVWGTERHITAFRRTLGVPAWFSRILAWLTYFASSLRLGANLFEYEPAYWVGKIAPRPILFIQGDQDQYVPPREFEALYAAAGQGKEAWRVTGAGHCVISQLYPEEFHQRIVSFFNQNL